MMGIGLHCLLTEVPLSSLLHHYSRNVHWTVDSDRCRCSGDGDVFPTVRM